MISRRMALGSGAVVIGGAAFLGVAEATHRLDDLARAVGIDPKPEPDPGDVRIVRAAARDLAVLLVTVEATAARHPGLALAAYETIGREHLAAVGGTTDGADASPVPASSAAAVQALRTAYARAATTSATRAAEALSPALVRVLASMSAGLAQCAVAVRGAR